MLERLFKLGICIGIACIVGISCRGEVVDPRYPQERLHLQDQVAAPSAWWLPARIRQLEAEQETLIENLADLPRHEPKFAFDHLGYHSLIADPGREEKHPDSYIKFKNKSEGSRDLALGAIALVPAFNPLASKDKPYAFPRRFKIDVLDANTGTYDTVVDWLDEDFPDPGPYPVFFADINRNIQEVRITVPSTMQDADAACFALGEVFLFEKTKKEGGGSNMARWTIVSVEVSDSFTMPQLWDVKYLNDGANGFGLPLSDAKVDQNDLLIEFDLAEQVQDEVVLIMDLGSGMNISRIDFWPAEAPHQLAFPSFGFPDHIMVQAYTGGDMLESRQAAMTKSKKTDQNLFRDNPLSIYCQSVWARYLRINLTGLRDYKRKRFLSLGEIMINSEADKKNNIIPVSIKAPRLPREFADQLPRLFDGFSQHRRILTQEQLIKGLAQRRPIDRRLAVVQEELAEARAQLPGFQWRAGIWIGSLLCTGLIGGMVLQRRQRRNLFSRLKRRITRDLHDEVGSILGSISLTAGQLPNALANQERYDLSRMAGDISLLSREACASLREVVWLTDQEAILLPALIQKLIERAERVLTEAEVVVDMPAQCPDTILSMAVKRHLIMLFKEVVHNCARHAHATRVHIAVTTTPEHLEIRFVDNGCGFDSGQATSGWGLSNMRERAEEMRGEIELTSRSGSGTTVVLRIPMESLSREPSNAYSTSN